MDLKSISEKKRKALLYVKQRINKLPYKGKINASGKRVAKTSEDKKKERLGICMDAERKYGTSVVKIFFAFSTDEEVKEITKILQ